MPASSVDGQSAPQETPLPVANWANSAKVGRLFAIFLLPRAFCGATLLHRNIH
jgi:hypothetical protein